MFSVESFVEHLHLTLRYEHIGWDSPPVKPELAEFLDSQPVLLYGVLYIAENEEAAAQYLRGDISICSGAVMVVARASDCMPQSFVSRVGLTVIGVAESCGRISNQFAERGSSPDAKKSGSVPFLDTWHYIVTTPRLTHTDIKKCLSVHPELTNRFCRVILASFAGRDSAVPYARIVRQLKLAIPDCCAARYNNDIVILQTYPERTYTLPEIGPQISELLEKHDGYMIVSNGSSVLTDIKCQYGMVQNSLGFCAACT